MSTLHLALIQTNSNAVVEDNIATIAPLVAEAAGRGAELIALPENVFYMREAGAEHSGARETEATHPGVLAAARWATEHQVWVLVGSVAVAAEEAGKSYNRALLMAPDGRIAARYDKIHLFDVEVGDGQTYCESARIVPGARAVVAHTPWAPLGLSVCYDVRFPQLYRALAQAGARMLAVPAAFTEVTGEAHWHTLLRARAIENACFVIAPAQCGTHPGGRRTFGHSLVVDPWGRVLADGGEMPGVVYAEIDLSQTERVRRQLPSLQHDRPFTVEAAS